MKSLNPYAQRDLREFGAHVRNWQKVHNLTADELAARADIGRSTLRDIETGKGTSQFAAVMSVLTVLGADRPVVEAVDPLNHDLGRMRAHLMNRERVR